MTARETGTRPSKVRRFFGRAAFAGALIVGALSVTSHLWLQAYYIPSGAMENTLRINDRLMASKVAYRLHAPRFGEIAIFRLIVGALSVTSHLWLQAYYIPSGAMENTLRINDRLMASKVAYRLHAPRFGEIAIFRAPPEAFGDSSPTKDVDFIKRCIGTPGDVVYAHNRQYFRKANGETKFTLLQEPYVKWSPAERNLSYAYDMKIVDGKVYSREYGSPNAPGLWQTENTPITDPVEQLRITQAKPEAVPADKFLVLGDHRNNSNDSHVWGFVPRANFRAKALSIFWPPDHAGRL